jgi:riboflavin-specific deaminase-like protein
MSRLAASRQAAVPANDVVPPVTPGVRPDPVAIADDAPDCSRLWALCLEAARRRREGLAPAGFLAGGDAGPSAGIAWRGQHGWSLEGDWSPQARQLFALYRPLLSLEHGQRFVIGHLAQSLDGRIATSTGDSCYITGAQNLAHMHRLRALCDAVLVGAGTVVADDPQLTTRLVPGPDATRVVLDPSGRLGPRHRVCTDPRSPTLVARYADAMEGTQERCGLAEIVTAPRDADGIDLGGLLELLARRGLHAILVEGGGITVSRFLQRRLLDRLQVAVAPVIIGSGRQGLQLPEVLALADCLRPACRQHVMGDDVLWDLELRPHSPVPA